MGKEMLFIECMRHGAGEQLIKPMMIIRAPSFDVRIKSFSMLLSATTTDSN
jgi:hypothetical protein